MQMKLGSWKVWSFVWYSISDSVSLVNIFHHRHLVHAKMGNLRCWLWHEQKQLKISWLSMETWDWVVSSSSNWKRQDNEIGLIGIIVVRTMFTFLQHCSVAQRVAGLSKADLKWINLHRKTLAVSRPCATTTDKMSNLKLTQNDWFSFAFHTQHIHTYTRSRFDDRPNFSGSWKRKWILKPQLVSCVI